MAVSMRASHSLSLRVRDSKALDSASDSFSLAMASSVSASLVRDCPSATIASSFSAEPCARLSSSRSASACPRPIFVPFVGRFCRRFSLPLKKKSNNSNKKFGSRGRKVGRGGGGEINTYLRYKDKHSSTHPSLFGWGGSGGNQRCPRKEH